MQNVWNLKTKQKTKNFYWTGHNFYVDSLYRFKEITNATMDSDQKRKQVVHATQNNKQKRETGKKEKEEKNKTF